MSACNWGCTATCCLRLATILSTWPLACCNSATSAGSCLRSCSVSTSVSHLLALSRLIWVWLLASTSGMDSWVT